MKPYLKLASTLVMSGIGIFMLERFGLSELGGPQHIQLNGTLLTLFVVAPVVLILAGCVVFIVGRMRRL